LRISMHAAARIGVDKCYVVKTTTGLQQPQKKLREVGPSSQRNISGDLRPTTIFPG